MGQEEFEAVRKIISNTVLLLCKNGITVDKEDVLLVKLDEIISDSSPDVKDTISTYGPGYCAGDHGGQHSRKRPASPERHTKALNVVPILDDGACSKDTFNPSSSKIIKLEPLDLVTATCASMPSSPRVTSQSRVMSPSRVTPPAHVTSLSLPADPSLFRYALPTQSRSPRWSVRSKYDHTAPMEETCIGAAFFHKQGESPWHMVINGHKYTAERSRSCRTYWYCSYHTRYKCRARVSTELTSEYGARGPGKVVSFSSDHNHGPCYEIVTSGKPRLLSAPDRVSEDGCKPDFRAAGDVTRHHTQPYPRTCDSQGDLQQTTAREQEADVTSEPDDVIETDGLKVNGSKSPNAPGTCADVVMSRAFMTSAGIPVYYNGISPLSALMELSRGLEATSQAGADVSKAIQGPAGEAPGTLQYSEHLGRRDDLHGEDSQRRAGYTQQVDRPDTGQQSSASEQDTARQPEPLTQSDAASPTAGGDSETQIYSAGHYEAVEGRYGPPHSR